MGAEESKCTASADVVTTGAKANPMAGASQSLGGILVSKSVSLL